MNQLTREDNKDLNKTITYTYNAGGNITSKKEYAYTTGTLPSSATKTTTYTYGNTNWKDQLTNYGGKAITYDTIGNVATYNGYTYTWQNGRQLTNLTNGTNTYSYKYNEDGIRTQKTVNGTATNYYLEGSRVIYEKTGSNVTYYNYDENGQVIGLNYNGTQYYYIKNAQNDIIGILNSSLSQVVSYTYDSWGNLISIKDANGNSITSSTNIGIINPYRYRSYRYDTEIKLYYLQSRYYNPEWGRFINADGILESGHQFFGNNLYAYCDNNSINGSDPTGKNFLSNMWNGLTNTIKAVDNAVLMRNRLVSYKAISGIQYAYSHIWKDINREDTK
jgi:RHS repeat-associated protein